MVQFAIWIIAALVIICLMAVGLGALLSLLKFIVAIPYFLYIGVNEPRLKSKGFDTELKSNKLPTKDLFRFYSRAITLRRPLIP